MTTIKAIAKDPIEDKFNKKYEIYFGVAYCLILLFLILSTSSLSTKMYAQTIIPLAPPGETQSNLTALSEQVEEKTKTAWFEPDSCAYDDTLTDGYGEWIYIDGYGDDGWIRIDDYGDDGWIIVGGNLTEFS